jgi:hypothetical protein
MMDRWQHALTQNDTDFKELFGVKKEVFHKMHAVLTGAYQREHKNGGRAAKKLPVGNRLLLTLQYWREYRMMTPIAYDFGVQKVR